jgi:Methyltransferase small domain
MVEIATPLLRWKEGTVRILEPSAGQGAIVDGIKAAMQELSRCDDEAIDYTLDLVEIDPLQCRILNYKGYEVQETDFLTYQPRKSYDLIIMNPPFAVTGDKQAYMTHIYHAWEMLKPQGQLIAITPTGFLYSTDKRSTEFLKFVAVNGTHGKNGKGRFKASGTGIDSCTIVLTKSDNCWRSKPREGARSLNWHVWCLLLHFDNDEGSCERQEALIATILAGKYGQNYLTAEGELAESVKLGVKELYSPILRQAWLAGDGIEMGAEEWAMLYCYFVDRLNE